MQEPNWDRAFSPASETPLARLVARGEYDDVRERCSVDPSIDDLAMLHALYDRTEKPAGDDIFQAWERDQLEHMRSTLLSAIETVENRDELSE